MKYLPREMRYTLINSHFTIKLGKKISKIVPDYIMVLI